MILSPQQQSVLNELIPIARIATNGVRADSPFPFRTHSLIIGPSGGGKSFLAASLSISIGLPILIINVSSWVVLSARNEPWTFSSICQWLDSSPKGGIIVLDELDKITNGDWGITARLEVMSLLDLVIPLATKLPVDKDNILSWDLPAPDPPITIAREVLEKCLRERVFIVGCGAWQHEWRSNSRQIGFPMKQTTIAPPSREQLLHSMEPELLQRFRNKICWLPPMGHADYQTVSDSIERSILNPEVRGAWGSLADAAIEDAVANGLGMRVFEELMLTALLQTQRSREAMDTPTTPLNPEYNR